MRNKYIASILAFLVGCFGIHWFYLGKQGKGLTYLLVFILLCWTFIAPLVIAILSLIDCVVLLVKDDTAFDNEYNEGKHSTLFEVKPTPSDVATALSEYKRLLDNGTITQEEFDNKKNQLLNM